MKSNPLSRSEKGQAIVLLVLAIVGLLGFTALAVDGSMIYSDRRYAQAAADASALAGAAQAAQTLANQGIHYYNWNCPNGLQGALQAAESAAIERAASNDVLLDTDLGDNHGVDATCGQEYITLPRAGGGSAQVFLDKYIDVKTVITHHTRTAFAHFVFGGELKNTATAIARIRPRSPLAYGHAIVALRSSPCSGNQYGVQLHGLGGGGSNSLTLNGGGIWSNGCLDVDGNVNVTINNGGIVYFFTANNNNLGAIVTNPPVTPIQLANDNANRIPLATYQLPPPNCAGHQVTGSWLVNYAQQNPANKELPPGLYCVTTQLTLNANDELYANNGVTLVLYQGMKVNGSATFQLQAPTYGNAVNGAIPGVAIYVPPSNPPACSSGSGLLTVEYNGGSTSRMRGSVYAPDANVVLLGNADNHLFQGQYIGCNVEIGGSTGTQVIFDMNSMASIPPKLELNR